MAYTVRTCQDTTITNMSVSMLTLADTITKADSKFCKMHVTVMNVPQKDYILILLKYSRNIF